MRRGGPPPPVAAAAAFGVVERCACAAWCAVASLVPEHVDLQAMGCQVGSGGGGAVSSSPFDLMFYPNDAAAARVPNSTPHVDSPGLVTVIPVAATPGLRVRNRSGVWRDVEATGRPCEEVVILVDAALQALSKGALEACTHEVAKADEPRLSLVYELRPAMDIGRAILEGDWPPDEEDCPLFMTAPPRGGVSENAALAGLAALVDEEDEDDPPAKRRRTSVGEAQVELALL
uniref:Isopenicillin N synthase-like Fe(2+) 2OG dioxygenase domain-containing protein n=1 Tax=Pelagomonas calceolata TaxID=35677 RepID=A0A7S3ZJM3_9STRA